MIGRVRVERPDRGERVRRRRDSVRPRELRGVGGGPGERHCRLEPPLRGGTGVEPGRLADEEQVAVEPVVGPREPPGQRRRAERQRLLVGRERERDPAAVRIGGEDGPIGFIRKAELSRDRSEQRPDRFAKGEKVDAKVTSVDKKNRKITLSIKQREIAEEKEAMAEYGSTDTGASLGEILGPAMRSAVKEATSEEDESAGSSGASKKSSSSTSKTASSSASSKSASSSSSSKSGSSASKSSGTSKASSSSSKSKQSADAESADTESANAENEDGSE